jgi:hypothetical protein
MPATGDPGSRLPRHGLEGSPCVGCARPCCCVNLGPSRLPLEQPFLPPILQAQVLLLHHCVAVCELVGPRHGHVPKVGLLCRVGKAGCPATGGLPRLPDAVPPSDARCHVTCRCSAFIKQLASCQHLADTVVLFCTTIMSARPFNHVYEIDDHIPC